MNPIGLRIEIEGAIWRNQVEPFSFKMAFNENLSEDFKRKILEVDYYERNPFNMQTLKKELAEKYKILREKQLSLDSIDVYKGIDNVFCLHELSEITDPDFFFARYDGSLLASEIAVFSCAH